ncbi:hypothetical protein GJAV_G00018290 [Gymnothorax javanicus]|nr:hypothetical protein GJAV_G00018290 [Gymnothorax javanicus]
MEAFIADQYVQDKSFCEKMCTTALRVSGLDFQKEVNTKLHHTSDFSNKALIVRRGQNIKIRLHLNRELNPQDKAVIQLSLGQRPLLAKGTLIFIPIKHTSEGEPWSATITDSSHNQCEVDLRAPPNAIVGKYSFLLKIGEDYTYPPEQSHFYLLFNPWCKDDSVYLPDEKALVEYVLSDMGYIYTGHSTDIGSRPWNFGQFEEGVLEVCIELLDKAKLSHTAKGDAVKVSRVMSALVNSNDDRGVVVGRWTEKYPPGTSPGKWTGSASILLQYAQNKSPVKYGQCWVFSGVLTTVLRCLGIPARSVTNFNSAHDTDGNLTIDIYVNRQGEHLNDMTSDSIWNFHVWNDVWMKRPDLPEGNDGWQALDATPQEQSEGVYQCGPCSLRAIKRGDVYLPHDTGFVFAEVNADRVLWMVDGPGHSGTKLRVQRHVIGKKISTKAIGQDQREDITHLYKFSEGERIMAAATSLIVSPPPEPDSVQLEVKSSGPALLGSSVSFSICLSNPLPRSLTLTLATAAELLSYTGNTKQTVKSLRQEITIEAGKSTTIPMQMEASEYMSVLSEVHDKVLLLVTGIAKCDDPNFICIDDIVVGFEYPTIKVELPTTAKLGKQFVGTFTFKNTTGMQMDDCKLHVEGLGLFQVETFDQGNIAVNRIFKSEILCTPYRTGKRKIIATIISNQISGITAEGFVNVE